VTAANLHGSTSVVLTISVIACSMDSQCDATPSTPVCDTSTGACVQCNGPADCAQGDTCVSNDCVAACTSASCAGQVCDMNSGDPMWGQCVGCLMNSDCPFSGTCSNYTCSSPQCLGGVVPIGSDCQSFCNDIGGTTCSPNGYCCIECTASGGACNVSSSCCSGHCNGATTCQ
jgi:hypothetical protein